ncbi:MAG: SDR family NAD(P)-dependent oxidoreductase [Pseudomonadota bacterium]
MSLENQIAVVTGAASGIGRASAARLAQDGADVAIVDLNEEGLEGTRQLVEEAGRRCLPVTANLLDRAAISAAFTEVEKRLGPVSVLHNNAGGAARGTTRSFPNATVEQWDEVLTLNLRQVADCTREVIGGMKERGYGRIVLTSSEQAFKGGPGFTDYAAAKSGLLGFTRSLALEMAKYQVTVNAICPGVIRTGITDGMNPALIEASLSTIPMGRIGEPEEIAHAVSFFASPGASYVTGAYLLVTGGRTIH